MERRADCSMTRIAAGETKPSPFCTTREPQKLQRKYLPQAGDECRDAAQESLSFLLLPFFHSKRLLVVTLARASVSSREVVDVCSIHKACWETVTGLRRPPRTRRTGPSAFRNGQMATVEAFQSSRSLCDGGAALSGRLCPAVRPSVRLSVGCAHCLFVQAGTDCWKPWRSGRRKRKR